MNDKLMISIDGKNWFQMTCSEEMNFDSDSPIEEEIIESPQRCLAADYIIRSILNP